MATLYVAVQLRHPNPPVPPMGYGHIHPVTTIPDPSVGDDGDFAVNIITGDVYVRYGDTWTLYSSSGGAGEVLLYTTTGPTADGILPSDLDHEAIAVKPHGSTFTWDSVAHSWDDV